ncbi:hypothetical protein [Streptomyces hawaiiensis]|uniref:hypothetical protein n=1 Tax=Streptomyces hawaiiensis TaxID=67305 RepID=UPI00364C36FE
MDEDIRGGETAVARLVRGTPLGEVLDSADPGAWTALDVAVRTWAWYSFPELPDAKWVASRGVGAGDAPRRLVRRRPDSPADSAAGPAVEPRLALALCHPDGRTREEALAWAAAHPSLRPRPCCPRHG